ncbi:MAG TPA: primosomal replication protein N [Candidatus Aphodousia gallistercoris]|nr:primosomal replication protein N [Candidatus Aphodousia gallistercoris]
MEIVDNPVNRIELFAEFTQKAQMRYTPSGVAVLEVVLHHVSVVKEAGVDRKLEFDFPAKACGDIALALDKEPLGSVFKLSGFIAPRSQRSRQLIVHITQYS